ncbi:sugar ABC transporter substrate-binding protein [Conexibacter sp. JD483]|uniref:ABC transporter substrate-binding protein n=1 Tax=unclassified Conexibacter TaxID=2627773 RepID=UPI0027156A94|nr:MULTISPECIES: sugar ABC transporter substrate-binding protein [unclassified Conexibacter]MDO8189266.1 sugar ABC transporter substrate-binding protein [Conexibacter sp. CPCC 205706]MDO8201273.1 sugar ABC transporter substrate-binding protein [Conexibacter sp. CPCC 205762]MDR9372172.1 sugar ABC transporter substrate-binding protein [Conexibacter sp. JD483]
MSIDLSLRRLPRVGAAIGLAVSAAALAACGSGSGGGPSGGPAGDGTEMPTKTVASTVRVDVSAAPRGTISVAAASDAPGDIALRKKQAEAFQARYPGTKVNIQVIPRQGYDQKIMTQIAGGSAPDVIGTGDVQIPTLVNRNFALDLSPYMEADREFDSSDWYPEVLRGLTYDGKVVGLSDNWDTQALYYNRALFRAAGVAEPTADWTWDDYRAAAEKLTSGEGPDKVWGSFWQKWFVPVADAVAAAGGSVYDEAGRRCTLTEPEGIEALTFLDDLRRAGVDPGATEDRVLGREPDEIFAAGKAAMLVGDGRWGAYAFNEAKDLDWAVAELPRGPAGRSNFFHLAAYSIPSNSKNPDLAWAFLRFMTSREGVMMGLAESQGVPAIKSVATSAELRDEPIVKDHNALQPFLDSLPTARRAPQLTDFNRYQDRVDEDLLPLWRGKTTPQAAAEKVCKDVDAVFASAK